MIKIANQSLAFIDSSCLVKRIIRRVITFRKTLKTIGKVITFRKSENYWKSYIFLILFRNYHW